MSDSFSISFASRDEVIKALCLKIYGAVPDYPELHKGVEANCPVPSHFGGCEDSDLHKALHDQNEC